MNKSENAIAAIHHAAATVDQLQVAAERIRDCLSQFSLWPPDDARAITQTTVGLVVKGTIVDGVVVGSPAFLSCQLRKGDEILKVDGQQATQRNIEISLDPSRPPGSAVSIEYQRCGSDGQVPERRLGKITLCAITMQDVREQCNAIKRLEKLKEEAMKSSNLHLSDLSEQVSSTVFKILAREASSHAENWSNFQRFLERIGPDLDNIEACIAQLYAALVSTLINDNPTSTLHDSRTRSKPSPAKGTQNLQSEQDKRFKGDGAQTQQNELATLREAAKENLALKVQLAQISAKYNRLCHSQWEQDGKNGRLDVELEDANMLAAERLELLASKNDEIESIKSRMQILEASEENAKAALVICQSTLKTMEKERSATDKQLALAKQESKQFKIESAVSFDQLIAARENSDRLGKEVRVLQDETIDLKAQRDSVQEHLAKVGSAAVSLLEVKKELISTETENAKIMQELQFLQNDRKMLEKQLAEVMMKNAELLGEAIAGRAKGEETMQELQLLRNERKTLADQLADVKHTSTAQLSTADSRIALFEIDFEILQQANSILAKNLADVKHTSTAQLSTADSRIALFEKDLEILQQANGILKTQLSVAEETLIMLQKEINECQHATLQMEELEEKRWKLLLEKDAMLSSKHRELAEARCKAEDKDQALAKALEEASQAKAFLDAVSKSMDDLEKENAKLLGEARVSRAKGEEIMQELKILRNERKTLAEQLAEVKQTSTAQLSTADSRIAQFDKDLENLQRANSILAKNLADVKQTSTAQLNTADSRIALFERDLEILQQANGILKTQLSVAEETLIMLQKEINECQHATLQMEELEEKRWKLLLEKDAMLSSKHRELAEARCKAEDKDQALAKALEEASQAKAFLDAVSKSMDDLEKENAKLFGEARVSRAKGEEIMQELKILRNERKTLAEQLAEVKHTSTAQLSTADSRIAQFEKDLENLQRANSILAKNLADVKHTSTAQLNTADSRIALFEKDLEILQQANGILKTQLSVAEETLIMLQKEINECQHATLQMEELEEKRWKLLLEKDAMLSSKHRELAEARCKAEDKDQALAKALEEASQAKAFLDVASKRIDDLEKKKARFLLHARMRCDQLEGEFEEQQKIVQQLLLQIADLRSKNPQQSMPSEQARFQVEGLDEKVFIPSCSTQVHLDEIIRGVEVCFKTLGGCEIQTFEEAVEARMNLDGYLSRIRKRLSSLQAMCQCAASDCKSLENAMRNVQTELVAQHDLRMEVQHLREDNARVHEHLDGFLKSQQQADFPLKLTADNRDFSLSNTHWFSKPRELAVERSEMGVGVVAGLYAAAPGSKILFDDLFFMDLLEDDMDLPAPTD